MKSGRPSDVQLLVLWFSVLKRSVGCVWQEMCSRCPKVTIHELVHGVEGDRDSDLNLEVLVCPHILLSSVESQVRNFV